VPWLRRLVDGFSPRRPRFDPGSVHVKFVVDEVALGDTFFSEYFGFALSVSFHRCSITRQNLKKLIVITRLHNKPQGCGASVASAVGPFTIKIKINNTVSTRPCNCMSYVLANIRTCRGLIHSGSRISRAV
jgi:hypothetical protein